MANGSYAGSLNDRAQRAISPLSSITVPQMRKWINALTPELRAAVLRALGGSNSLLSAH